MVYRQQLTNLEHSRIIYRNHRSSPYISLIGLCIHYHTVFVCIKGCEILTTILQCYFYLFHILYAWPIGIGMIITCCFGCGAFVCCGISTG